MSSGSELNGASPNRPAEPIGTRACPHCYLCGQRGEPLHSGLRDGLFGAEGSWNLRRCPNAACGLAWLDPMPREDEIAKAYQSYYTHTDATREAGTLRRLVRATKAAYRRIYLEADGPRPPRWLYLATLPLRSVRAVRDELDVPAKYFAAGQGRALDLGCGNGDILELARAYGWAAEGVDADSRAVANARGKGLDARSGTLAEQGYPAATFDLITMNHVIEHLHDPVGLLHECHRVLKPGGLLVVLTPNVASHGHRKFGPHWRGLEPPRHLMLFNAATLGEVARRAGFAERAVATTLRLNPGLEMISRRIRHGGDPNGSFSVPEILRGQLLALAFQLRHGGASPAGDELLLEARK